MSTVAERFWAKVKQPADPSDTCWLWTASLQHAGYGQFRYKNTMKTAHRFAYEHLKGPIPEGLVLDHLCRVRHCVNPDHLEPVTPKENILRGVGASAVNAKKVNCIHGHSFVSENTYIRPNGSRECRSCKKIRDKEYYWRKKNR